MNAAVLHDDLSQCWNVNASVTLTSQEKLILAELRKQPEKLFQGQVVVCGHLEVSDYMVTILACDRKPFN